MDVWLESVRVTLIPTACRVFVTRYMWWLDPPSQKMALPSADAPMFFARGAGGNEVAIDR